MNEIIIDVITINDDGISYFVEQNMPLEEFSGMFISQRQQALNFRHRISHVGYQSDWHVAGDPTLIVVLSGALEIELRNGDKRVYHQGLQFIAADYLPEKEALSSKHGHRARVIGEHAFQAVHIKLDNKPLDL